MCVLVLSLVICKESNMALNEKAISLLRLVLSNEFIDYIAFLYFFKSVTHCFRGG